MGPALAKAWKMDARIPAPFPYKRIAVVGATGNGKSLLAEKLARRFDLDYIELDALYWKPGWVESGNEEFRSRVDAATRAPAWAIAGNYGKVRDIIWPRAEAVIWLDYPFLLVLGVYGTEHGAGGGRRNCSGEQITSSCFRSSDCGRRNRCSTGWCKVTGGINAFIHSYLPARNIPTSWFTISKSRAIRING